MPFSKGNTIPQKHGYHKHPLYSVWQHIKSRCYNRNDWAYRNYGGIGITVCDEWRNDPKAFIEWGLSNGWKRGLQIDKDIIPKKMGIKPHIYSPSMCCFVTRSENNLAKRTNRIIEHNGKRQTLLEWSRELGVSFNALSSRLKRGNSLDKKTKRNKRIGKLVTFNGKSQSLPDWAKEIGITYKVLHDRVHKHKMPLSKALSSPKYFARTLITYNGETKSVRQWAKSFNLSQPTLHYRLSTLNMSVGDALTLPVKNRCK